MEEAKRLNANTIDTAHILLALLKEDAQGQTLKNRCSLDVIGMTSARCSTTLVALAHVEGQWKCCQDFGEVGC